MDDIFNIVTHPAPSLHERSIEVPVKEIGTPAFQAYLNKLLKTMEIEDGIGIASPQVGIQKRVIIVSIASGKQILINPEIVKTSESQMETEEGCLSVPTVYGLVTRPRRITVRALDRHARRIEWDLKKLDAIVLQHEVDHVDGILFIDKMTKQTRGPKIRTTKN